MRNQYFSVINPQEQRLFQNLVDEQIKMYGIDVYYLPRKIIDIDKLFREVRNSEFDDAFIIEAYLDTFSGFGGNGDLMTKFGLSQSDDVKITISKTRYEQIISPFLENNERVILSQRPQEGDLIYFPLTKNFFEIKFVEHEDPFYQVGGRYMYRLSCELYEYDGEKVLTKYEEVDTQIELQSYNVVYTLSAGTGKFKKNETVIGLGQSFESQQVQGNVVKWVNSSKKLTVSHINETFGVGVTILGVSSGSSRLVVSYSSMGFEYNTYAENKPIEILGDSVVNFTEKNALGQLGNFMGSF
jgi:hypothetical protein